MNTSIDENAPELLAGEYVLGTLDQDQRARVEAELETDPRLRLEVAYWEQHLGALGLQPHAIDPPAGVWSRVSEQIQLHSSPHAARRPQPRTRSSTPSRPSARRGLWAGFALAASVALCALAAVLYVSFDPPASVTTDQSPVYASMIQDPQRGLAWLVTADTTEPGRFQVVAMGSSYKQVWADRALELWLLPPDGAPPRSLGLLPEFGSARLELPADVATQIADLRTGGKQATLAVSEEPPGGSPQSGPTGEVVYTAPLSWRDL